MGEREKVMFLGLFFLSFIVIGCSTFFWFASQKFIFTVKLKLNDTITCKSSKTSSEVWSSIIVEISGFFTFILGEDV